MIHIRRFLKPPIVQFALASCPWRWWRTVVQRKVREHKPMQYFPKMTLPQHPATCTSVASQASFCFSILSNLWPILLLWPYLVSLGVDQEGETNLASTTSWGKVFHRSLICRRTMWSSSFCLSCWHQLYPLQGIILSLDSIGTSITHVPAETKSVACQISQMSQCSILGPLSASTVFQTCYQFLSHLLGGEWHVGETGSKKQKSLEAAV